MRKLERSLNVWHASALVVGTVIGTGVFLKTAVMAQQVGASDRVFAAWAVAGALSFTGALSYAELGSLFPQAGGEYVFLREAYGRLAGFLYGWTRFWIATPGSIAAYAVGAATFAEGLLPAGINRSLLAVGMIAVLSAVNCLRVVTGGWIQAALTALKVAMILGLTAAVFIIVPAQEGAAVPGGVWSASAFGSAVLAALWAFDGWNNLPMAAGEIRNPESVLPKALGLGMFAVFGIYVIANLAYFHALPFTEIVTSNSTAYPEAMPVATKAVQTALGSPGVQLLSFAFVVSALGALSGSILTGARVPFAMAADGLFFRGLGRLSESTNVPVVAVMAQGLVAGVFAFSGSFDQLTDCVVFASWIYYALATGALFIFRRRYPDRARSFRTPGYPFVPAVFLVCSVLLLVNTLAVSPGPSLIGLGLIALGIPAFRFFR